MIHLPTPSAATLTSFASLFEAKVIERIKAEKFPASFVSHMTSSTVTEVLTAPPKRLADCHNEGMQQLIPGYDEGEYDQYVSLKKTLPPIHPLVIKYGITSRLMNVFNYAAFISSNKPISYQIAEWMATNCCTYCNRNYTFTVRKKSGDGLIRPYFDHWLAKHRYPILALSFYNLIPSCSFCNSSVKGMKEFNLASHPHPYITKCVDKFSFSFDFDSVNNVHVVIKYNDLNVQRLLSQMHIEEIYNAHSRFELQDLYDLKQKYNDGYLATLFTQTFPELSVTQQELYRLIFGIEGNDDLLHKRIFSKFKRDIIDELVKLG